MFSDIPDRVREKCHVNTFKYTKGPRCYGNTCYDDGSWKHFETTNKMGVLRGKLENIDLRFLPNPGQNDGQVLVKRRQINAFDDKCRRTSTPFGMFNYRDFGRVYFEGKSWIGDGHVHVAESISENQSCAEKCFSKAGCTAWWRNSQSCLYIIGPTKYLPRQYLPMGWGMPTEELILQSGRLDDLCPNVSIKNEYSGRSLFDKIAFVEGRDPDELIEEYVAQKIALNSNFTEETGGLNQWNFKIYSENPPITISTYLEMEVFDAFYCWDVCIRFTIQTHVRVGKGDARARMPRSEDMLAEINAISQEAFDYIGEIEFPDDVTIIATTPIETVQLVQKTADGSIAADCTTGSCQCSKGFIDNGNGCTEMTPQQAATTQAPTTQAPTTPTQTRDWIPSLVGKIQEIFEADRPGKARPHLLKKWEKLRDKFNGRYESMANSGCDFADTYQDNSMRIVLDFETIDACRVSVRVLAIFFRSYYMVHIFRIISGHQPN